MLEQQIKQTRLGTRFWIQTSQRLQANIHTSHVTLKKNVLLVAKVVIQITLGDAESISDVLHRERR